MPLCVYAHVRVCLHVSRLTLPSNLLATMRMHVAWNLCVYVLCHLSPFRIPGLQNCQDLIREVLPDDLKKAAVELEPYLRGDFMLTVNLIIHPLLDLTPFSLLLSLSACACWCGSLSFLQSLSRSFFRLAEGFGNATRIDYGTGHELKFMAFICCLMKIGVIPKEDGAAVVLRIASW